MKHDCQESTYFSNSLIIHCIIAVKELSISSLFNHRLTMLPPFTPKFLFQWKRYQTLDSVLLPMQNLIKIRHCNHIFNSLLGVWIPSETLSIVFDIFKFQFDKLILVNYQIYEKMSMHLIVDLGLGYFIWFSHCSHQSYNLIYSVFNRFTMLKTHLTSWRTFPWRARQTFLRRELENTRRQA